MPRRKTQLVNGEFYHIVKRGVEERKIFLDDEDRLRFVNSLLVFNDQKPVPWYNRAFWKQRGRGSLTREYSPSYPLVEIHAFALMPNHFHLLLRQTTDQGIKTFIQKLGGYSYYFNQKYDRTGSLFQGRYRTFHIKNDDQMKNVFVYIHTNPVALVEPKWKDWIVQDKENAIKFLEDAYSWSSYYDYLGKGYFLNLVYREFLLEIFGGAEGIRNEINDWISFKASTTSPGLVVSLE